MKLKNRLIIGFLIIAIVPMLMMTAATVGFGRYQMRVMKKDFGIDLPAYESFSNTPQIMMRYTRNIHEELNAQVQKDPDVLVTEEAIQKLDEELNRRLSYVIVRKGDTIIYESPQMDQPDIVKYLPDFGDADADLDGCTYLGGDIQSMIKQVDVTTTDGGEYSFFLITSAQKAIPQIQSLAIDIILMVFLILIMTGGILTAWIYRGVITPVRKLKVATQNIKEGNLDFRLEVEGKDEISELCSDFEEMRQRLKASTEEKIQFDRENKELISNISHDLKTPITAVKGYVEGIMDGVADTPEKMDRYIKTIYNKANDMDRLINELTFYSKIDTNRIPYTFSKINVKDYFDDCAEELGLELEERGMTFTYQNHVDPATMVIADAEQLKRVIDNIVGNSVKYMDKENGHIGIEVKDVGDFIQVELSDDGRGIAMKDVPYIFDRFYRADASRNSSKGGSGIGLSIVKKIIEDHGGKIWANSREGEGTTMYFVLRKYQEVPANE